MINFDHYQLDEYIFPPVVHRGRKRELTEVKERIKGKEEGSVHSSLDDSWTQRDLILKIASEKTVTNGGSFPSSRDCSDSCYPL